MVTVAVAAILLTVVVPNFNYLIMNNRMIGHVNQFVGDINLARSTAVKYQRNATLCVSTSYASSTPACTGGTDWTVGWIVWVDENANNTLDAGEVIKINEPLSSSTTFTSTTESSFIYDARGFLIANDDLSVCDNRTAETGRKIVISNTGRTSLEDLACL
jgi:type IV fimbrial biogenesis protein FimT